MNFPLVPPTDQDAFWMQRALEQAYAAKAAAEVPVGAAIVIDGRLIAEAYNLTKTWADPTAHAELIVLRRAAKRIAASRITGATLYVTLEPCAMCAGALVQARIDRLVFGAADPKTGMCGSLGNIVQDPRLNHRVHITSGVLARESSELLVGFFRERRARLEG